MSCKWVSGDGFPHKVAQAHMITGTNCLGPFLFTKLLLPTLEKTASTSPPGDVRVTWGASSVIELTSPNNGIDIDENGSPKVLDKQYNYGQSKCGNVFFATEYAKRFKGKSRIVHLVCCLHLISFSYLHE